MGNVQINKWTNNYDNVHPYLDQGLFHWHSPFVNNQLNIIFILAHLPSLLDKNVCLKLHTSMKLR